MKKYYALILYCTCGYGRGTKKKHSWCCKKQLLKQTICWQSAQSADGDDESHGWKLILTSKTHKTSHAAATRDGHVTRAKGREKSWSDVIAQQRHERLFLTMMERHEFGLILSLFSGFQKLRYLQRWRAERDVSTLLFRDFCNQLVIKALRSWHMWM